MPAFRTNIEIVKKRLQGNQFPATILCRVALNQFLTGFSLLNIAVVTVIIVTHLKGASVVNDLDIRWWFSKGLFDRLFYVPSDVVKRSSSLVHAVVFGPDLSFLNQLFYAHMRKIFNCFWKKNIYVIGYFSSIRYILRGRNDTVNHAQIFQVSGRGFQNCQGVSDASGISKYNCGHAFGRGRGIKGIIHLAPDIGYLNGKGTTASSFPKNQRNGPDRDSQELPDQVGDEKGLKLLGRLHGDVRTICVDHAENDCVFRILGLDLF